ncbi:MAG: lipase [Solirubrobacterales bacterium]|nr:lipase [Solirubrobacterales bacterium]
MLRTLSVLLVSAALLIVAPAASAADFADPAAPGPELSVTKKQLSDVLLCSKGVDEASRAPVLLFQGTGATAEDNWSWTYQPALDKRGIPWCAVDIPDHATSDIQIAGEYAVAAIREVHRRAGRKVSIIGHSQGGMSPRWALRFWPDTRGMVDDVIGFAPSNHGTTQAMCSKEDPCSAAAWQQRDEADLIRAVNSGAETWKGIDYTVAYSQTDEIVQPNADAKTGSSSLRTGEGTISNVAVQSICPVSASNSHLLIGTVDPVAHGLALDALDHDGPADPSRVSPLSVCGLPYHEGVNTLTLPNDSAKAVASFAGYQPKLVPAEPKLACYVAGSCPASATAPATGKSCVSRRRFTVRLPRGLRSVSVTLNGKRLKTRRAANGRRTSVVDLRGRGRGRVTLRVKGRSADGKLVKRTRKYRTCG